MPTLARYYRARSGKVHRVDFTRQTLGCGKDVRDMTALESLPPEAEETRCARCFPEAARQWPTQVEGQRYVADRYGVVWLLVPEYDEGMATTATATGVTSVGINVLRSERGPLTEIALPDHEPERPTITIRRPQIHTGPKDMTVDEATVHYLRDATKRVHENRYWGSGVTALVTGILKAVADEIERTAR